MSEATSLPDAISPEDMLRIQMATDALRKAVADYQDKQKALANARDAVTAADAVVTFVGKELAARYSLTDSDKVEADGAITRTPNA